MLSVELKSNYSQGARSKSQMQRRPLGTFENKRTTLPTQYQGETMASTNLREKSSQASRRSSVKVYDQHVQNSKPSSYGNNIMKTIDGRGSSKFQHAKAQTMLWNEFMDQKI